MTGATLEVCTLIGVEVEITAVEDGVDPDVSIEDADVDTAGELVLDEEDTALLEVLGAFVELETAEEVAEVAPTSLAMELAACFAAFTSPLGQTLSKQLERSEYCLENMH